MPATRTNVHRTVGCRHGLDEIHALTRAQRNRQTFVLYWERANGQWQIYRRNDDWDPDDASDLEYAVSTIDGDIPLNGWIALAEGMLIRLEAS